MGLPGGLTMTSAKTVTLKGRLARNFYLAVIADIAFLVRAGLGHTDAKALLKLHPTFCGDLTVTAVEGRQSSFLCQSRASVMLTDSAVCFSMMTMEAT